MWTRENRGLYERKGLRYPSDLTDEEWALIAPLIPPAKRGGAAPRGGCARGDERGSLCSGDRLPVARAAQGPAAQEHGARLSHAVGPGRHAGAHSPRTLPHARELEGRAASPSAGVIDSQSVKGAETHTLVGRDNSDALSMRFVPGVEFCISS